MNFDTLFIGNVNSVYHYFGKGVLFFHSKLVPPVKRFKQRLGVDFLYLAFYQKELLFVFVLLGVKLAYLLLNVPEKNIVRIYQPVYELFRVGFNAKQLCLDSLRF